MKKEQRVLIETCLDCIESDIKTIRRVMSEAE